MKNFTQNKIVRGFVWCEEMEKVCYKRKKEEEEVRK